MSPTMQPPQQPLVPASEQASPAPGQSAAPVTAKLQKDAARGAMCANCEYYLQDDDPDEGRCNLAESGDSPLWQITKGTFAPTFYCIEHEFENEPGEETEEPGGEKGGMTEPHSAPSEDEIKAALAQLSQQGLV